jgi:hypothetical protein
MLARLGLCLVAAASVVAATAPQRQQGSLLQTWRQELDRSAGSMKDTPVTRVVNLLKEMSATLAKEQEEDEALYDKLACWCNNNRYEKDAAIKLATAKIAELKSTIDASTAKSAELKETLNTVEAEVAADKAALAEATAQREKEAKAFRTTELKSMEDIESLKNAIKVLSEHQGSAFPQFSISLLSLGSHAKDIPWSDDHESQSESSFDKFMARSGLSDTASVPHMDDTASSAPEEGAHFLQREEQVPAPTVAVAGWSDADTAVVRRALNTAAAFVQQKHETFYAPQSGEILGVMKQLLDEMQNSLSGAQRDEKDAATNFNELRAAKTSEIDNGERTSERKEDELAETNNALAEAKEDLVQTTDLLTSEQKFMVNLKTTCTDADGAFDKRKAARQDEIKAVAETIAILTADEARDNMGATYSFVQTVASTRSRLDIRRQRAATLLRNAAATQKNPELSMLATTVELDAFTKVKKAIDDMIGQLKVQQEDEVKKNDWCSKEFQSNDMSTMKANSAKDDLEAKVDDLESTIGKLIDEIVQAKKDIAQLTVELQRASENRKQANMDFQKTISEQSATQDVLKAALERLAKFYDSFAQVHSKAMVKQQQTRPVAQATYEKSQGASGVMSMIEKLIYEAKGLQAEAKKGEQEEQAQYEALVEDTNASIKDLSKLIVTKTSEKAEATQGKAEVEADLADTKADIEGLAKYNADLHGECDYIQSNFQVRQDARQQEIEALQQAKSILSGASVR